MPAVPSSFSSKTSLTLFRKFELRIKQYGQVLQNEINSNSEKYGNMEFGNTDLVYSLILNYIIMGKILQYHQNTSENRLKGENTYKRIFFTWRHYTGKHLT